MKPAIVSAELQHRNAGFLAEWARRESKYRANSYQGIGAPDELFIATGTRLVLLTAPHSVAQVRDGERKKPDLRTGGLAELVAVETEAGTLTALGSGAGDPNWDAEHEFKRALDELTKTHPFVLDLHGMDDRYGLDVCIGSGSVKQNHNASLVAKCEASARSAGLRVSVDHPFSGDSPWTITSTAQRLGCSAVQIEIAAHRRDPQRNPEGSLEVARWLIGLVQSVDAR